MNWLLVAYLLTLAYLTAISGRFSDPQPLQKAWQWFAVILISRFFFTFVRVVNIRDPQDLALTEIWSSGIEALLLGVSIHTLSKLLAPGGLRRDQPPPPSAP